MIPPALVPVETWSTTVARFDPLAAYQELAKLLGAGSVALLESMSGPQRDRRQSLLPLAPVLTICLSGSSVTLSGNAGLRQAVEKHIAHHGFGLVDSCVDLTNPSQLWRLLRVIRDAFAVRSGTRSESFRFGYFGYFGYDVAWTTEDLPRLIDRDGAVDDVVLSICSAHAVVDLMSGEAEVVLHRSPGLFDAPDEDDLITALSRSVVGGTEHSSIKSVPEPMAIETTMNRSEYLAVGAVAQNHIRAGDIYQVQMGHEVRVRSTVEAFDVYCRLRERNPSPYMFLANFGDVTVVGASPELCVRVEGEQVSVRPIAGTIARGKSASEDEALVAEMLSDAKEIAEHIMLVDLGRNDISRVAQARSLDVDELMVVERYSHVSHLVSNVVGTLKDDVDAFDAIAATFPAGTMTGAPKIRAMEIIESLEHTSRGIYAGAIGVIDFDDYTITALGIRSVVKKADTYYLRASAGFVADSVPELEWAETIKKMAAPFWAVTGKEISRESIGD